MIRMASVIRRCSLGRSLTQERLHDGPNVCVGGSDDYKKQKNRDCHPRLREWEPPRREFGFLENGVQTATFLNFSVSVFPNEIWKVSTKIYNACVQPEIAVYVRYKSLYISLQFSANQQREIIKLSVFQRTWTTEANFSYFNLEFNAGITLLAWVISDTDMCIEQLYTAAKCKPCKI